MFVFINPGHAQGGMPDPGAVNMEANLRECDIAMTVGRVHTGAAGTISTTL